MSALLPDGAELRIASNGSDPARPYRLERRQPGAGLDPAFGVRGQVPFSIGGDEGTPGGLQVDDQGAITVFGFGFSTTMQRQPALLRFDAHGTPDARWGPGGAAPLASFGTDLAPEDVLPTDDGRLLIIGTSEGLRQRAVLWRLLPNGQLDSRFGSAGWMILDGTRDQAGMALAADGAALLLGIKNETDNGRPQLDVLRWRPDQPGAPVPVARQALPDGWADVAGFAVRHGQRGWLATTQRTDTPAPWAPWQMLAGPAVDSAPATEEHDPAEPGAAAFSPYGTAGPAASAPAASGGDSVGDEVWLAASVVGTLTAALGWFLWRRARQA